VPFANCPEESWSARHAPERFSEDRKQPAGGAFRHGHVRKDDVIVTAALSGSHGTRDLVSVNGGSFQPCGIVVAVAIDAEWLTR
jgi:hypothetical protein